MNGLGKKIQEQNGVDMTPSDSRTVMGHWVAQTQIACSVFSLKKETD